MKFYYKQEIITEDAQLDVTSYYMLDSISLCMTVISISAFGIDISQHKQSSFMLLNIKRELESQQLPQQRHGYIVQSQQISETEFRTKLSTIIIQIQNHIKNENSHVETDSFCD
jgi:hypothetical protein